MKLMNFQKNNEIKIGVVTERGILDLQEAGKQLKETVPSSMEELVGENDLNEIATIVKRAEQDTNKNLFISEEEVIYAPVLTNPEKIVCVGLNYLEHIEESKVSETPKEPVLFSKFNNALAAHNEKVPVPRVGEQFDYEAALVMIIGKEAKNVSTEEALSYVFGYSVGNDLSIRDLQFKSGQWLLGKTADKFAPVGPCIVTADSVDPTHLAISLKRNGKTVQSSNTKYMVFDCATIISYISKHMTLKPGDLIFTGTPEGVVLGKPEEQREWLKAGEELEVTIESVGTLRNTFESF